MPLKEYADLYALLSGEASPPPPVETMERLRREILAGHPTATHLVLFRNGHWSLVPIGPAEKIGSISQAHRAKFKDGRKPVAFCKL